MHSPSGHEQVLKPSDEFDAFVSYATASDYSIARRVESFLESFHQLRNAGDLDLKSLHICVDGSDFKTIPRLRENEATREAEGISGLLVTYLMRSRRLIVLCSRGSQHSSHVNFEVRWFLEHKGADSILLVVTDGNDPMEDPESVFPAPILEQRIHERPWYDVREYRGRVSKHWAKVRSAEDSLVSLAANLNGYSAGEIQPIWFRERRQRRRRTILIGSIVATMLCILGGVAAWQRGISVDRGRLALARRLAAESQVLMQQSAALHTSGLLLALESIHEDPSIEADQALRQGLAGIPRVVFTVKHSVKLWTSTLNTDGSILITSDLDKVVHVWRLAERRQVCDIKRPYVSQVQFSPDSQLFVTAGQEGAANRKAVVEAWLTADCRHLWSRRIDGVLTSLHFDSKGRSLTVTTDDKGVQIINAHSGSIDYGEVSKQGACDAAFLSQRSILATVRCGIGVEIDQRSERRAKIAFLPGGTFKRLSMDATGSLLAVSAGNNVLVRMLANPTLPLIEFVHPTAVENLNFCVDKEALATSSFDGYARLWKLKIGAVASSVALPTSDDFGVFSADCRFISATSEQAAWVFETRARAESAIIFLNATGSADTSEGPEGYFAQLGKDHWWRIGEASGAHEVARVKAGLFDPTIVSSANDDFQAQSGRDWRAVEIRDGRSEQLLSRINYNFATQAMSFNRNGDRLGVLGLNRELSVWDWRKGNELLSKTLTESCSDLSFSGDGRSIAIGCDSGRVEIVSADAGRTVSKWTQDGAVMSIRFHPHDPNPVRSSSGPRLADEDRQLRRRPRRLLQVQQEPLACEAPGVAGQPACRADDPMAGHDDAQRIPADSRADLLRGHVPAEAASQGAVGRGAAVGNLVCQRAAVFVSVAIVVSSALVLLPKTRCGHRT